VHCRRPYGHHPAAHPARASPNREQSAGGRTDRWIGLEAPFSPRARHRCIRPAFQKSTPSDRAPARERALSNSVASLKLSSEVSWNHVGSTTIAFLESDRPDAPRPAMPLAMCDARSHALSELLDWRSTDVS
jgi:hypothetical protein